MKAFDKVRGLFSRLRHHSHLHHPTRKANPPRAHGPEKDVYQPRPARPKPRIVPIPQDLGRPLFEEGVSVARITLSDLQRIYQEQETLGSGMSGEVKKAMHLPSGQLRAVKKIKLEPGSDNLFGGNYLADQLLRLNQTQNETKDCTIRAAREVCGLLRVDHPSIVKLHELFLVGDSLPHSKRTLVLGMEFVDGTNLLDEICNAGNLSENEARRYLLPVTEALLCMHNANLVHRDVKSQNILCQKGTGKLIDLGFTRLVSDDPLASLCGSEKYAAPELWLARKYDGKKSDVWSLGVTLYAAALGRMPFENTKEICGSPLVFPREPQLSSDLKDLITRMMDKNPQTRMSMAEVLAHPWMQGAKRLNL